MGKLYEDFKNRSFTNEAEVSQNFIIPLLCHFLGYSINEIIPEKHFPAKDLHSGVNFAQGGSKGLKHRPDYVVCIDGDYGQVKFIIDSKGPGEKLDAHLGQLRSYANSVGRNFLMITNGGELQVYDVNTLIFHSKGIKDLQCKLVELIKLLGKKNQQAKSPIEILQALDLDKSVSRSEQEKIDQVIEQRRIQLSDFNAYLLAITAAFNEWHLPTSTFRAINNLDIKKIDPNELLSFRSASPTSGRLTEDKVLKFPQIDRAPGIRSRILTGETGTGKTSLLKYLTLQAAERALQLTDTKIPVYIALKEIGHGYNLEHLISAFLQRHGYQPQNGLNLYKTNRFIFLFDAFDEVAEIFQKEVCRAIANLAADHDCYITTRPNAIPRIQASALYTILPLTDTQVEKLSRAYMGSRYYDFQRQIENNGLIAESRNTLLLLFLISLYTQHGQMPDTVARITRAIVERVGDWQDSRDGKNAKLAWDILSRCLAEIAYKICETDQASMTISRAEILLRDIIIEQETLRKIPQGTTIRYVLDALEETGLLIANNDHLYFWHRLFLNHFAALSLKEKYLEDHGIIERLSTEERWEIVIISMCSILTDITQVIRGLKKRLWLACYCLLENPACAETEKDLIISTLTVKLSSPVPDVRSRAMNYLEGIDNSRTRSILLDIFDQHHHDDVIMMALPAIGKTGSPEARKIINQRLDWNESDFLLWRSSQSYVVQALSFYGEEGHLQIVKNWRKYGSAPLQVTCKKIFLRLFITQKPGDALLDALQQLYLDELAAPDQYREKVSAIAEVLSLNPDTRFAEKVLEIAAQGKIPFPKLESLVTMMKSCDSVTLAEKISLLIFKKGIDHYLGEKLADALMDSAAPLPKAFYKKLTRHTNINIASTALESLDRFPFNEVKSEINRHLYGKQAQLQSRALQLLVRNGKFIDLVRQEQFPSPFYTPTAHTLLEAVRRFHLTEALPLLYYIQEALSKNKRYQWDATLAFELAGTFYYMGEAHRHQEIVSWYFNGTDFLLEGEHTHNNLMKKVRFLDPGLAQGIADCYFKKYLGGTKSDRYEFQVFLETAEDIGGSWMREKVREIATGLFAEMDIPGSHAKHQLERPFRTLVKIGKPEDEDWVLGIMDKLSYDAGFEYPQLRRAIEYLAHYGTTKALPTLLETGSKLRSSPSVLNICQSAYNSICSREKVAIDDRDGFAGQLQ
ncbi:hypothetical protein DBR40_21450 [Pedobacter sp. KBW01]|uniref:NACHT domain-containing protein n=1 Tax=Pedobacter sp. KBW01 TaxID=2153364 RepID=UPI000F5AEBB6|nr:NACHT domain-containing protein [Pedobacter sp. KBW01]RQO66823.1 hypothetical protein DBR40_21450 [Pedobacter sp. KBW01]